MCPPDFNTYVHFILHITDVQNGNTSKHKLLLLLTQTVTHTCKADYIGITSEIYLLYMIFMDYCDRATRDAQVCFPHSLPWPCKH